MISFRRRITMQPTLVTPTVTRVTKPEPKSLRELLPPATVVLHNDDVNTMEYVVFALLDCVTEVDYERALEIMLLAHQFGQSDVISCPFERAELYRNRLESHNLSATIRRG